MLFQKDVLENLNFCFIIIEILLYNIFVSAENVYLFTQLKKACCDILFLKQYIGQIHRIRITLEWTVTVIENMKIKRQPYESNPQNTYCSQTYIRFFAQGSTFAFN